MLVSFKLPYHRILSVSVVLQILLCKIIDICLNLLFTLPSVAHLTICVLVRFSASRSLCKCINRPNFHIIGLSVRCIYFNALIIYPLDRKSQLSIFQFFFSRVYFFFDCIKCLDFVHFF